MKIFTLKWGEGSLHYKYIYIYMRLVKPIFDYAAVVRSPSYMCYVDSIEPVQE